MQLFFILSSIWLHQFYYVFGFLLLVFVILVITCAEITMVMCYFQASGPTFDKPAPSTRFPPPASPHDHMLRAQVLEPFPPLPLFPFSYAPRTTIGGGGPSSPLAPPLATCLPTPHSTSSQSSK
jgi:hypothetical protein